MTLQKIEPYTDTGLPDPPIPMKAALPLRVHQLAGIVLLAAAAISGRVEAGAVERTLYVSVVDRDHVPNTRLETRDFIVREDGIAREVLRVTPATDPIDVALLVDNSAAALDAARDIRDAARAFGSAVQPAHAVALIGLADRPTILADYTTDPAALGRGIDRLFPVRGAGMTLLDAIVDVSRGLKTRAAPRRAIVAVLTEGTEFSTRHYSQVLEALDQGGAAFFVVVIGPGTAPLDDPARNRSAVFDQGTRASGGRYLTVLSPLAVTQALARVANILLHGYKVVYARPESLIPPKTAVVSVREPGLTARSTPAREKP